MNEQIAEFLRQLNKEINRTENRIEQHKEELQKRVSQNDYELEEFGLSRYAETVTKLTARKRALTEQLGNFKAIFNITDQAG